MQRGERRLATAGSMPGLATACLPAWQLCWPPVLRRLSPQAYAAALAAKKAEAAASKDDGGGGGGGGLPAGLKLEDASVLLMPGTRDGQTKVVREGGAGVAYAWDASK